MKYLLFLIPVSLFCSTQTLPPEEQEVASFLIRDDSNIETPIKSAPASEEKEKKESFYKKQFIGICADTIVPMTCLTNMIGTYPFYHAFGLSWSARYKETLTSPYGKEFQWKIFPTASYELLKLGIPVPIVSFTYQKMVYFSPASSSSGYLGAGIGVSTYQGVPIHVSLGREFYRLSSRSSFIELRISFPFIFAYLASASITCGSEF